MSLKDVEINSTYETGQNDPVNCFLVPVLTSALSYDRLAGFFSSSSLAVAARGIAGLIKNGGKMRLIVSPKLHKEDTEIIRAVINDPEKSITQELIIELDNIQNDFEKDHLSALGWMLANGYLEIRIACVLNDDYTLQNTHALFHQKVGIFEDYDGNMVSFSGSINETASGWLNNIEEFKVFKSWESGQQKYVYDDRKKFDEFWNGTREKVKIYNLPEAVRKKIIQISEDFSIENFLLTTYKKNSRVATGHNIVENNLNLFPYQKVALQKWKENNYRLLFEMATGTGKTRTAIACIHETMKIEDKLLVIIATPQNTLSLQWKNEIVKIGLPFNGSLVADSETYNWKAKLKEHVNELIVGAKKYLVIYTTHRSASLPSFVDIITSCPIELPICFVSDETHALGANKLKNALLSTYKYRIGLSATPQRWFDDEGTRLLSEYFGDISFSFTIRDALDTTNPLTGKPFLVNYYYYPLFISLDEEELDEYSRLTKSITKYLHSNKIDKKDKIEKLSIKRANIVKNAKSKLGEFRCVLRNLPTKENLLIFVSPNQIDDVMKILNEEQIISHMFTQEQKLHSDKRYGGQTERQFLIDNFAKKKYHALVAMQCMNEGIDIPSADKAIILASSTNPREYIQRIGRVIRQSEHKDFAFIYDFIVWPQIDSSSQEMFNYEKKIFEKELNRVMDMSTNALNHIDLIIDINKKIREVI